MGRTAPNGDRQKDFSGCLTDRNSDWLVAPEKTPILGESCNRRVGRNGFNTREAEANYAGNLLEIRA